MSSYLVPRKTDFIVSILEHLLSLSFSPTEDTLLYSAEAHDPATNEAAGKDVDQYERFQYTPTFGEGFSGKKRPTLYVLRWTSTASVVIHDSVTLTPLVVSSQQPKVIFAQAILATGNRIFATGYEYMNSGRLLGPIWCYNRPTAIWELRLPDVGANEEQELVVVSRLSPADCSARSAHMSPDSSFVIWLSNSLGGAHSSCTTMHTMEMGSGDQKLVVETIWEPRASDGFPGLYEPTLTPNTFVSVQNRTFIVTSSYWRSRTTLLLIAVGEIKDLTPLDSTMFSWTLLGTDNKKRIVCTRSSSAVPHEVVLGQIGDDLNVSWTVLSRPNLAPDGMSQFAPCNSNPISDLTHIHSSKATFNTGGLVYYYSQS